jgi:hypothetical protein
MTAAAITKPCSTCKKHFIGLATITICPQCEKDSEFYRMARKKGDPRNLIPYPALFQQWKARRAECQSWRKEALYQAERWTGWQQCEQERRYLLEILTLSNANLDPALAMAAELDKTKEALERAKASSDFWKQQHDAVKAGTDTESQMYGLLKNLRERQASEDIPPDMRRRLIQLCHPDRHGNSEAAQTATRWLLEGRQ